MPPTYAFYLLSMQEIDYTNLPYASDLCLRFLNFILESDYTNPPDASLRPMPPISKLYIQESDNTNPPDASLRPMPPISKLYILESDYTIPPDASLRPMPPISKLYIQESDDTSETYTESTTNTAVSSKPGGQFIYLFINFHPSILG